VEIVRQSRTSPGKGPVAANIGVVPIGNVVRPGAACLICDVLSSHNYPKYSKWAFLPSNG
jgi:hypothetical protein